MDGRRSLIYQIAAGANLFILSLDNNACKHVVYVGHEPGSVVVPPLVVGDCVLVAVNDGARDAVLKVFAAADKAEKGKGRSDAWLNLVQEIRLDGHVQTPMLTDGRRILVTTNSGAVSAWELGATDAKTPLRELANTTVEGADVLVRFPLLQGGQFWIADNRLTKYDLQTARGRLVPKWIALEDSAFLQPPTVVGDAVVAVRRRIGMCGAAVSAVAMQDPNVYWETQIAAPPAGAPVPLDDGARTIIVTAGALCSAWMRRRRSRSSMLRSPPATSPVSNCRLVP